MNQISNQSLPIFFLIIFSAFLFNTTHAQDKPLLSEAIRKSIDNQGIEAAKKKFANMEKSERETYNIDMEGISELTSHYLEEGNLEALTAISEISSVFMQDMVAQSMEQYGSEMENMEKMAEQRQAEREQQAREREEERDRQRQQSIVERQGQPRDDLDRFTGLYGDPEAENSTRQLWVQASCDGYLVSGAMWGDASPWWLRSESDNAFTTQSSFNSVRMEFKTGDGGTLEMVHDLEFMASPLQRTGPLPDDWDSCLERYR